MLVLVAVTTGLVFWITAWALGTKAFDAFLVVILLALLALVARLISPWARSQLGR